MLPSGKFSSNISNDFGKMDSKINIEATDLMMVFYLQIDKEASCLIQNTLCNSWGITKNVEKTLFAQADMNTERLKPASLKSMAAVLKEMLPESLWDEMELEMPVVPPMYVLSTEDKIYGAATILYRNNQLLKECLEKMQEDLQDQLSDNIFSYNPSDGFQQITFTNREITR